MSSLNKLYKEYRGNGLVIVAVATDRSTTAVRDFLSVHPVDFHVLMDPDNKVSKQFKVFSLPTAFLLDNTGKVLQRYLGEEEWDSAPVLGNIKAALGIQ